MDPPGNRIPLPDFFPSSDSEEDGDQLEVVNSTISASIGTMQKENNVSYIKRAEVKGASTMSIQEEEEALEWISGNASNINGSGRTEEAKATEGVQWSCPICTLLNPNTSDACKVCLYDRQEHHSLSSNLNGDDPNMQAQIGSAISSSENKDNIMIEVPTLGTLGFESQNLSQRTTSENGDNKVAALERVGERRNACNSTKDISSSEELQPEKSSSVVRGLMQTFDDHAAKQKEKNLRKASLANESLALRENVKGVDRRLRRPSRLGRASSADEAQPVEETTKGLKRGLRRASKLNRASSADTQRLPETKGMERGLRRASKLGRASSADEIHPTPENTEGMGRGLRRASKQTRRPSDAPRKKCTDRRLEEATEEEKHEETVAANPRPRPQELIGAFGVRTSNGAVELHAAGIVGSSEFGSSNNSENISGTLPREPGSESTSMRDLAVATPVALRENSGLPRAQHWPVPEEDEQQRKWKVWQRKWAIFGVMVLVIVVVVVAVLVVVFVGKSKTTDDSEQNKEDDLEGIRPGQSPDEYVVSLLPEYSLTALEDPSSAQSKAFDWIMSDPSLEVYQPPWRILQRFALATLYLSAGGDRWIRNTNWLSHQHHECEWWTADPDVAASFDDPIWGGTNYEFYNATALGKDLCAGASAEEYQFIILLSNSLEGTLPPELSLLSSVRAISLRNNKLRGRLPSQIGQLSHLFALDVSNSHLTGSIPSELGLLRNLTGLFTIQNPKMGGHIPSEIGLLSGLDFLVLESSGLTGPIPTELGLLQQAKWFLLTNNKLTGSLPSELGNLNVYDFHLFNNSLTGTVPTEFGNLRNTGTLAIGDNHLNGTLPTEIGNMEWLTFLGLYSTELTGTIPTELGKPYMLQGLLLSNSRFNGTLPSELGLHSYMWGMSAFNNSFTGTLATELAQMRSLYGLQLNGNQFSGQIPSQMGELQNLELLDLSGNQLTGSIPTDLGLATRIQELRLNSNQLTGSLPSTLGLLFQEWFSFLSVSLGPLPDILDTAIPTYSLFLANNNLKGTIPSELGLATKLRHLLLAENLLTGTMPEELGMARMLKQLSFHRNQLEGSLCSQIGQLSWLELLDVHQNALSHSLPSELGMLHKLETFHVASNAFTGKIPAELVVLADADRMDLFNLSDNVFSGTIATELCRLGSSIFSFDCSETLCGCSCACLDHS